MIALDSDELLIYGAKPDGWKPSGKRVKRGLYRAADGKTLNADTNGADTNGGANILRKVSTQLSFDLAKVTRAVLTLPQRYDLFQRLSKFYRKQCGAVCVQTTA